jgi:hypothetical protein
MTTKDAALPRRLNMEEKRKLEKVMFADIESAIARYDSKRSAEYNGLEEQYLEKPPRDAARLYSDYRAAKEQMQSAEKLLRQLFGINIDHYPTEHLSLREPNKVPTLEAHRAQTSRTKAALNEMKRGYTLKLFAGGEEAQELFASLTRELEAIIAK